MDCAGAGRWQNPVLDLVKGNLRRPPEVVKQAGAGPGAGLRHGGCHRARGDLVLGTGLGYALKPQVLASKSG